jgi:opacity protein-like surface antigen
LGSAEKEEGMKRVLAAVLALALIGLGSTAAWGQAFEFGPKVGYSIATGDFGDVADDGFAYGFFANYFIKTHTLLELSYLRHDHDAGSSPGGFPAVPDDLLDGFANIDDSDITVNEFTLSGVRRFGTGKFKPYLAAGAGVYLTSMDIRGKQEQVTTSTTTGTTGTTTETSTSLVDFETDESLTDIGVRGGGGVMMMLTGELSLGVEAIYTYIFGDFDSGLINVSALFSYGF